MKPLREQFADTMLNLGQQDKRLVVMVGDISHGILQPFANACEGRYLNIGICEPAMVSMSAGLSKQGFVPVVHTIAPFLIERSFEQIKLDYGYQGLSGNFISVGGAFDYAQLGCSHHCYTDVSLLCHIENSQVFCPSSAEEFDVLFSATYDSGHINYFRLTENPHGVILDQKIEIGKIMTVREGKDISLIAVGPQLKTVFNAAETLANIHGIDAEILYVHTIKPFDNQSVIQSLQKTTKAIVIEELSAHDGVFNLVHRAWDSRSQARIRQLAIDHFVHKYGNYESLCQSCGLDENTVVSLALELCAHG